MCQLGGPQLGGPQLSRDVWSRVRLHLGCTADCAAAAQVFGTRCRRFPTNSARTRRALCCVHDRAACLACAHVSHWLQSCHDCDDVVFYHHPVHAREVANAAVSVGGREVGHQCCGGGGVALRNK